MGFKKIIANNIALPVYEKLKKFHIRKDLKEYREDSLLSSTQLREKQFRKLKKLLIHAYETTEFYKKRFDEVSFNPYTFLNVEEYDKIPFLTRNDLQNNYLSIKSSNYRIKDLIKGSSSGSTGQPVVYYKDKHAESKGIAAGIFGWELSGWHYGMKGLHIWGNPSTVLNEWENPLSKIKVFLTNHYKFAAYRLTDVKEREKLFDVLQQGDFDFIDGYTNSIYLLSLYMKENGLSLGKRLKFVFTTAENLHDYQRELINEKIGPVYDGYGCSEINGIAYECARCGLYHVVDTHVFMEFDGIANELSEVILTDLDNYAFPLIRYKNGDACTPLISTTCDYKGTKLKKIDGRVSDMIFLKDGGVMSVPSFFGSMLLKKVKGIVQYQVVKSDPITLIVKLVVNESFTKDDESLLVNSLKEYLENKINFTLKYVKQIEISKNGKFKLVVDKTQI